MAPPTDQVHTFLRYAAPWIRDCQIAVYLQGRQKPMTELTVCGVYAHILVARANSSTHLIPTDKIVTIRFAPDSEPGRNPNHPLHSTVRRKGQQRIPGDRETPGGPRGNHKGGE